MAKSFITTVRVRIEDVATIAAFMKSKGIPISSKADPIVLGFESLAERIRQEHPSLTFTVSEALEILTVVGIDIPKRGIRILTKELQNHSLEEFRPGPSDPVCGPAPPTESIESAEIRRRKQLDDQLKIMKHLQGLEVVEEKEKPK